MSDDRQTTAERFVISVLSDAAASGRAAVRRLELQAAACATATREAPVLYRIDITDALLMLRARGLVGLGEDGFFLLGGDVRRVMSDHRVAIGYNDATVQMVDDEPRGPCLMWVDMAGTAHVQDHTMIGGSAESGWISLASPLIPTKIYLYPSSVIGWEGAVSLFDQLEAVRLARLEKS